MNKRDMALALAAGFAGVALAPVGAFAAGSLTPEEVRAAIDIWLVALRKGDEAAVAKALAPEFQIQRSDGKGFNREEYLKALPKHASVPDIRDLHYSTSGDILVMRYTLHLVQEIGGKPVEKLAPRLTVLRQGPGGWLVVAHANFAQIG